MLAPRSTSLTFIVVSLAALAGCSDSESSPGAGGGASGNGGAAQGGSSGQTGNVGGSTSGGTGGGSGGSAGSGVQIEPDPLKDCGEAANPSASGLALTEVAGGLQGGPVYVTQPRGDNERLFIVEKAGWVRILRGGVVEEPPFLDIEARVNEGDPLGERGLLGFAFHPEYMTNGRFFVYYSTLINNVHFSRISEFTVSADPDAADTASEQVLFEVQQPQENHNGGDLEFGRDGFLYIAFGDGGGGGDNHGAIGNGQDLQTPLGKILRIDVDGTGSGPNAAYSIPPGNFDSAAALDEIWSYGWRNPWRFSFDPCTGDMYIADVGQGALEEVDFEPALTPGRNYGWRLMEGDACFNPGSGCNAATQNLTLPVATYGRNLGGSITGGYVYRGSAIPNLRGTYLYADYASHRFFALRMNGGQIAGQPQEITADLNPNDQPLSVSSFGQDNAGEVYVVSLGGDVYKIVAQ